MKILDYAMAALIVFAVLCVTGKMDLHDANVTAAHKGETIATAKIESIADEKAAAHRKAQELRDARLLDDANRMMAPCCQAQASK